MRSAPAWGTRRAGLLRRADRYGQPRFSVLGLRRGGRADVRGGGCRGMARRRRGTAGARDRRAAAVGGVTRGARSIRVATVGNGGSNGASSTDGIGLVPRAAWPRVSYGGSARLSPRVTNSLRLSRNVTIARPTTVGCASKRRRTSPCLSWGNDAHEESCGRSADGRGGNVRRGTSDRRGTTDRHGTGDRRSSSNRRGTRYRHGTRDRRRSALRLHT